MVDLGTSTDFAVVKVLLPGAAYAVFIACFSYWISLWIEHPKYEQTVCMS